MRILDTTRVGLHDILEWPDQREVPCKDLDLDCFAFDEVVPFGDYGRCHAYDPGSGRCIFLAGRERNYG